MSKLEDLRGEAKESLLRLAASSEKTELKQPVIKVYDETAPRSQGHKKLPSKERSRSNIKEPSVPR